MDVFLVPQAPEIQKLILEVTDDVIVNHMRVVRRFVGTEIFVNVAIGKPLRAHIIKVVGGLQFPPGVEKLGITERLHNAFQPIDAFGGRVLYGIAQPGGEITVDIGPGHRIREG